MIKLLKLLFKFNKKFVQCKARAAHVDTYNCCVKKEGHKGPHMNLEGQCF